MMGGMGADGKMLGRVGARWHSSGRPLPSSLDRGGERAETRREIGEEVGLGNWVPDGAWDGVSDFEADEPLESLLAATSGPPDGYTEPPPGWTGPVR